MIRTKRLTAALALGAALTAAGVALAQTQTGTAAPRAASAQPAPPQTQPPWAQPDTTTIEPWDPNYSQPTYSVDPPPEGSSGVYLPAAVLGYAKSAAGCVVVGCDDGPQVGPAPEPSSAGSSSSPGPSPGAAEPPPGNPGPSDPH